MVQGVQSYGGSNFALLHRNGLSPNLHILCIYYAVVYVLFFRVLHL